MSDHNVIYRKDYQVPDFLIPQVEMFFDIHDGYTTVDTKLTVKRNEAAGNSNPLSLIGEGLELLELKLDGEIVAEGNYTATPDSLVVNDVPGEFVLETKVKIYPEANNSGMGMYKSGIIYCSQNEPEGFRKITYYLDRPDVMGIYTVTIEGDKEKYPFLLCNGNNVGNEDLGNGRHRSVWNDPFPKPSYLFAIVAGDLAEISDTYKTMSGRTVDLKVYVDKGNEWRADHCMESLKKSMKWDEDTFGLECDLDIYMIVAVDTFNMGAMENKGLNIFNSRYVLADYDSSTDQDFLSVEGVVGHEYFHNWTGNRVTCRDWFQLTLKEGLTVFRDQEFSSDMNSRPVKRISSVSGVRAAQFPEDAGPMSHSIRPDSYMKIDNFYTMTVYQKGSEVIRMIQTLIGKENFRKGIDKYFELFDGQAVTCDDFVYAMEQASGYDLTQFKLWYSQAGTPQLDVTDAYDADSKTYSLTVKQSSPTQPDNKPFHMPLVVGLIDENGKCVVEKTLSVTKEEETFEFTGVESKSVPSLLRDFSAPVKLKYDYTDEELIFLMKNDDNDFNRFEASQRLAMKLLAQVVKSVQNQQEFTIDNAILEAYGAILTNKDLDEAFRAKALTIPPVAVIVEEMETPDFDSAFKAREFLVKSIALKNEIHFITVYDGFRGLNRDFENASKRALKNTCLAYLGELGNMYTNVVSKQFAEADNMTDSIAALQSLCNMKICAKGEGEEFGKLVETMTALDEFYNRWKDDALTINKWLTAQVSAKYHNALNIVKKLEKDPVFDIKNPNKVRALFGVFCGNLTAFHKADGSGYDYIADKIIEIGKYNESVASGLAKAFKKYKVLDPDRKALMKVALEKVIAAEPPEQVFEVVSKTLNQ